MPACRVLLGLLIGTAVLAPGLLAAPAAKPRSTTRKGPPAPAKPGSTAPLQLEPMTVEEARMTVDLLDDAYQTVLREVHHAYPTKPGRPVAASLVKDLQKEMALKGWPRSHFLAVNAIIMNPEHKARDEFEVSAVKALARGGQRYEAIENGQLRVATAVSLGGECFSCHWSEPGRASRAAISFAIPLKNSPETAAASH